MPWSMFGEARDIPSLKLGEARDISSLKLGEARDIPSLKLDEARDISSLKLGEAREIPSLTLGEARDIPSLKLGEARDIPSPARRGKVPEGRMGDSLLPSTPNPAKTRHPRRDMPCGQALEGGFSSSASEGDLILQVSESPS